MWDVSLGISRFEKVALETVALELSLGCRHLGTITLGLSLRTSVWKPSLDNLHLGSLPRKLSFGIWRLETFAWDLSLGNLRLVAFACEPSLTDSNLGTSTFLAWELSLAIFRLGTLIWD